MPTSRYDSIEELDSEYYEEGECHLRFQCPFCRDAGDRFEDYKLYYHKIKKVGYCFRCESVIVVKGVLPPLNEVLKMFLRFIQRSDEETVIAEKPEFSLGITKDLSEDILVKDYLDSRGVTQEIIDHWDISSVDIVGKHHVFIPDKVENDNTNFYQMRVIDNSHPKYLSAKTQIPLMKLNKHNFDRLFLVEGTFDALATGIEAIPLLGKSISKYQVLQLYNYYSLKKPPRDVFIMLDGGCKKESYKVARKIRDIFTLKSRLHIVHLPYGKDPDDISKSDLNRCITSSHRLL